MLSPHMNGLLLLASHTKLLKSIHFYLSNQPPAQWIRAQAATIFIVTVYSFALLSTSATAANALNTASQTGTSKSSAGSVGISWGTDGLLLNVGASGGRGKSNGQDSTFTNTQIQAGNTATLSSGGDTTLKGAVVAANTVKATVGGNLNIESLQDTSTYASSQQSIGGSVSIGYGNMRGSFNAAASKINSDFASVIETSGIKTGDGGFQVSVNNNTDLKGAVIASTQSAVDNNKNTFATGGTLTTSDIQNSASYSASKTSIGIGTGFANGAASMNGQGIGIGSDKGNASSTTTAGISGIAGNTAVRSTDAQTGIKPIFDAAKVQREIDAQAAVTQYFTREAPKAVASYADEKLKAAQAKGDQSEIDKWKEGGSVRVALHTLMGALSGGISGAAGAAASQSVVPLIGEEIAKLDISLEIKQALIAAAGTAIGAAVGGSAGAAVALTITSNNYLSHTDIRSRDQKLKGCQANGDPACEVRVLKEYDLLSARNTAAINYNSVLSESALQSEKTQLTQLLNDPNISAESKAQAQRSINELNVAINVIQKSPVLKDAAQLGLVIADVVMLGELALAKALTSTAVREYILSKTGKEITPDAAAVIANNFYRDGSATPQALATSSGVVIQATVGKTTTVLGNYVADMKGIIVEQTGIPKSMNFLDAKPTSFNILNVPDDYAATLMRQSPDAFWNQVNKPFLDAAIKRGDEIYLATRPTESVLSRVAPDGNSIQTGFGREYDYLIANGYTHSTTTGKMVRAK